MPAKNLLNCTPAGRVSVVRREVRLDAGGGVLERRLLRPEDRHDGQQQHVHRQPHRNLGRRAPRSRHRRPRTRSQVRSVLRGLALPLHGHSGGLTAGSG